MFVHKVPQSSYQRLLLNDISRAFKIVIKIHYVNRADNNFEIQKQKQIIINTTVNKARAISRLINEKYMKNTNINTYVFDFGTLLQNENYKCQIEQIISIFNALLESNGKDVVIPENNKNLFHQILSILENENTMNKQINANNVVECKYLYNDKLNGIISYIQQITRDVVDGISNNHLKLYGKGTFYYYPISNIVRYDKKNIDNYYLGVVPFDPEYADYIKFDFIHRQVNITGYTIRIPCISEDKIPKTWKIVGSNDGQKWEVIDLKENNHELSRENRCVYFNCTNNGKFFRIIRYEQAKMAVMLAAIEFFGYVITNY